VTGRDPVTKSELDLALLTLKDELKDAIHVATISESRVRELAREEIGSVSRTKWTWTERKIALALFILAVSTFVLTVLRGPNAHNQRPTACAPAHSSCSTPGR
jgi:hypothetical protein